MITLDELIERATELRNKSPLRGQTVVYVVMLEREPLEVTDLKVDADEDGAILSIKVLE